MKKAFEVLKGQPRVKIRLTRDSVAASDDFDPPHALDVETYSFLDLIALITSIHPGYLPGVAGVGHSWDCILNDRLIATMTTREVLPKVQKVEYRPESHLHFVYRPASY
jgi:hypothetical protein